MRRFPEIWCSTFNELLVWAPHFRKPQLLIPAASNPTAVLQGDDGTVFLQSQPSQIFTLRSCQGLNLTLGAEVTGKPKYIDPFVWYGNHFRHPPSGKIGQYWANGLVFHLVHPRILPHLPKPFQSFFIIPVIGVTP